MSDSTPAAAPGALSPELRERSSFAHWTEVTLRYVDEDPNGHVNNAVFATMLESGRVGLLFPEGRCVAGPEYAVVIVRLVLDFLTEMHYPGTVAIGTRVERIGRTSLTLGQGIFQGPVCAGVAETVLVLIETKTRRPAALTPAALAVLEPLRAR